MFTTILANSEICLFKIHLSVRYYNIIMRCLMPQQIFKLVRSFITERDERKAGYQYAKHFEKGTFELERKLN